MSVIDNNTTASPNSQYPDISNHQNAYAQALDRPHSVTLMMLDALAHAPDGLTTDELHWKVYPYPPDGPARDRYCNIRVIIGHYNHGRTRHAPPGRVVNRNRRYYWVTPDQITVKTVATVPLPLLVNGNRLVCRVEGGRLVVEGEAL